MHVRRIMFATGICVYVCIGVEGMYTCKTGNFGLCLCLCYCRGYIHR